MSYLVYKLTNKINNKVYIGFTSKSLKKRFEKHIRDSKYGRNTYLSNAIRKYGIENFSKEVLFKTESLIEVKNLEINYIKKYNSFYLGENGYNMTLGGEGTLNHNHSIETRKKMSKSHTGKKHTKETKNKLAKLRMGPKNPRYGYKYTKEEKQNKAQLSSKFFEIIYPNGKTEIIKGLKQYCDKNGFSPSQMSRMCSLGKKYRGLIIISLEKTNRPNNINQICPICGKIYTTTKARLKEGLDKTCSRECGTKSSNIKNGGRK